MKKLFSYLLISSMVILSSCTNYDDQFDDLKTQINTLKSQIEGFSSLSSGLTSLQGTVASLQSAVAALPQSSTDVSGLEADLASLSTLVETLQSQLAATQTALEAGAVSDAAVAAAIKVIQDNQAALDTAVDAVTAAQADLLAAQTADTATITAAQTAADEAADALAASVKELADELTALGTQNADLKTVTDLINDAVTLLTSNQAINTDAIADLVDAVAALDTDNNALSTLINTLSTAVTSNTEDILAAILAGNNVYSTGAAGSALVIDSPASLAVAESLGTKLGIINGGITISNTDTSKLDTEKLQALVDIITTVTGVVSYTHSGDAGAIDFTTLSSAGSVDFDAEHDLSFPALTTVTNGFDVANNDEVTSFSAPELVNVGDFNGTHNLTFSKATSIDLSALSYYDAAAALTIGGNTATAGWDLDMPLFQENKSDGIKRGFDLTLTGYVNLVELDNMVDSRSSITAQNAKTIVLDNFEGELVSTSNTHVSVTLGVFKEAYTPGTKLETFVATGVATSAATEKGPSITFGSTVSNLVSVDLKGTLNNVSFLSNANVESIDISAETSSINLTGASSVTSLSITGDVDGEIDINGANSLTSLDLDVNAGTVTIENNDLLASVTLAGAHKKVVVNANDVLTTADLGHTTAFAADRDATSAVSATTKWATLEVTANPELTSFTADKVTLVGQLIVTGNAELSSVSFDAISASAATGSPNKVNVGAALNAVPSAAIDTTSKGNDLVAQSIVESDPVYSATLEDDLDAGSITTNSGLSDLASYLTALSAKTTSSVAVVFDGVDSYTDVNGVTTKDLTAGTKLVVAKFGSRTNGALASGDEEFSRIAEATDLSSSSTTLTHNGRSVQITKTDYDTDALYLAAIDAVSIPGVTVNTGIIDRQGSIDLTNATITNTVNLKFNLASTAKASTYTDTTNSFVEIASLDLSAQPNTATAKAQAIAAALMGSTVKIGTYSGSNTISETSVVFNSLYTAYGVGSKLQIAKNAIVGNEKTIKTSTTTATVVDREATAPVFMMYVGTDAAGTYEAVNNYYIQMVDTSDDTDKNAFSNSSIAGNTVTFNGGVAYTGDDTAVAIAEDETYAILSGNVNFDGSVTTVSKAGGLTLALANEKVVEGVASNAADAVDDDGLPTDGNKYFNTTYWSWN